MPTTLPVQSSPTPTRTESIMSWGMSTSRPVCPLKGHITLVNRKTGEVSRAACERLMCNACRPAAAMRQAIAIAAAEPDIFATLTLVGDSWPVVRQRMNRFRALIRRQLPGWQDCYSVEANPRDTGRHVHVYAFTADPLRELDYAAFNDAAARAGMGSVVDAARFQLEDGVRSLGYAMKAVLHAPSTGSAAGQEFLHINGGRLLHATRGFFRDGPGGAPRTLAAAIRAAR